MQLGPGSRLAHYEVSVLLGRGGMGEVWRAKDTKLGREVAIKVLPEEFTKDAERLARFDREARVLASLQHPNVAAIHGFEEVDGIRFFVMQLAAGEDLAARLTRGPFPVDEAVSVAAGIAAALEAAHEKGIIHRDLKPGNVMVDEEGRVMVLDFGLAKALDAEQTDPDLSNSPTMVRAATHAGVILGTAAYMSPEQARGKAVDRRADIWAFGVVLYEMLTGRRLFSGETVSDTLAMVLTREINLSALPGDTPAGVRWTLERCLERDPRERLRDIGEARVALRRGGSPATPAEARSAPRPLRSLWVIGALIAGIGAGVAGSMLLGGKADAPRVRKVDIRLTAGLSPGMMMHPLISPDGESVLLPARDALHVRGLDSVEPVAIAASGDAIYACFAPDSRQVAFVARGRLWRAALDGRAPVALARLPEEVLGGGGMAWLPDDRIVIAGSAAAGLLEVPARGGTPVEVVPLAEGERDFHEVSVLPDGKGLLVTVHREGEPSNRIGLIRGTERRELLTIRDGSVENPVYAPPGYVLFSKIATTGASTSLWAVPFSLDSLEVTGEPFLVAHDAAYPTVAADGTVAFVRGEVVVPRQLLAVDMAGRIVAELARPQPECRYPEPSPDGARIAAGVLDGGGWDLVVFDVETRTSVRMTSGSSVEWKAAWTRDGAWIAYEISDRDAVAVVPAGRPGEARTVTRGRAPRWWPDGRSLAMFRLGESGSWDLWRHRVDEARDEPLLATPASEVNPDPSPDGRLVAYVSDESGREEVYVFEPGVDESKVQVSTSGSRQSRWSRDGRYLYFRHGDVMMRARRLEGVRARFGEPERLFSFREAGFNGEDLMWAVAADDRGFVVLRDVPTGEKAAVLTLVTNWAAEFDRK